MTESKASIEKTETTDAIVAEKDTSKKTTKAKSKKKTTNTSTVKNKSESTSTASKTKTFKQDTPILCKSVRQNNLSYVSHTGVEYRWLGFGDEREIPYGDILSLKAKKSSYLYEPWFLIMDEDLMQQPAFQKEFGKINAIYKEFDEPDTFFERPLDEIRETLKDAPKGLRDFVVYNAGQYIREGTLDRLGVINALDEMFGTNLRMMI